ncbi:hypothetical protein O3P69_004558 [Scylla paramamosain]|uniref:Macroglobulin domain-containing protein n=1 Tax=Scylla paramamosain TaxID=85552 RepID=A0AAW0UCH7_SCYPA
MMGGEPAAKSVVVVVVVVVIAAVVGVVGQTRNLGRTDGKLPLHRDYSVNFRRVLNGRNRLASRFNHPTHMVVAPQTVRPGALYRCVVTILRLDYPVEVRATIMRDGEEITGASNVITRDYPETLLLQIPKSTVGGDYRLHVEGNIPGTAGGTVFTNDTQLYFSRRFLTILVQTSRPSYNGGQTVNFRVILLTMDTKPYDDPVDVFVLDPKGYILRRWPSRSTNVGVVSLSFDLPFPHQSGLVENQGVCQWAGRSERVQGGEMVYAPFRGEGRYANILPGFR